MSFKEGTSPLFIPNDAKDVLVSLTLLAVINLIVLYIFIPRFYRLPPTFKGTDDIYYAIYVALIVTIVTLVFAVIYLVVTAKPPHKT